LYGHNRRKGTDGAGFIGEGLWGKTLTEVKNGQKGGRYQAPSTLDNLNKYPSDPIPSISIKNFSPTYIQTELERQWVSVSLKVFWISDM
jgi:hypothetical protein